MLGFGLLVHIAKVFGAVSPTYVELKGTIGLFDTVKPSCTCSVGTISLRLGVLPRFGGYFGREMAIFGPNLRRFGRVPPNMAPTPVGATGNFLAQNLDFARPPPITRPCLPKYTFFAMLM